MGFDLNGLYPKNKKGEYFRNNVWSWRPLWNFVCIICALNNNKAIISDEQASNGQTNSGKEFNAKTAIRIADEIDRAIIDGKAADYKKALNRIKREAEKYNAEQDSLERSMAVDYPFDIQNLKNFSLFCRNSGGFTID